MSLILTKNGIDKYYTLSIVKDSIKITLLESTNSPHELFIDLDSILVLLNDRIKNIAIVTNNPHEVESLVIVSNKVNADVWITINVKNSVSIHTPNLNIIFNGTYKNLLCMANKLRLTNSDTSNEKLYSNSNVLFRPTTANSTIYIEYFSLNSYVCSYPMRSPLTTRYTLKLKYSYNVVKSSFSSYEIEYEAICINGNYYFSDGTKISIQYLNEFISLLSIGKTNKGELDLIHSFVYQSI